MKLLVVLLVLCCAAIVAVSLAIYFRIRRHLRQEHDADASARALADDTTGKRTP